MGTDDVECDASILELLLPRIGHLFPRDDALRFVPAGEDQVTVRPGMPTDWEFRLISMVSAAQFAGGVRSLDIYLFGMSPCAGKLLVNRIWPYVDVGVIVYSTYVCKVDFPIFGSEVGVFLRLLPFIKVEGRSFNTFLTFLAEFAGLWRSERAILVHCYSAVPAFFLAVLEFLYLGGVGDNREPNQLLFPGDVLGF